MWLSMETPYLCPGVGHSNSGQKSMKTSGIPFCYNNRSTRHLELADIDINTFHTTSTVWIAKSRWMSFFFFFFFQIKVTNSIFCRPSLMFSGVKTPTFKMLYYKNEGS